MHLKKKINRQNGKITTLSFKLSFVSIGKMVTIEKYITCIRDDENTAQSTDWAETIILIPWQLSLSMVLK